MRRYCKVQRCSRKCPEGAQATHVRVVVQANLLISRRLACCAAWRRRQRRGNTGLVKEQQTKLSRVSAKGFHLAESACSQKAILPFKNFAAARSPSVLATVYWLVQGNERQGVVDPCMYEFK